MLDWNARSRTFEKIAGFTPTVGGMVMAGADGNVETVSRQWVTAGIFGRTRCNADPEVVGRQIRLDGSSWTVVGIVPADFQLLGQTSLCDPAHGWADTDAGWNGGSPLDGFRIMFHSASSARAAQIGREQIEKRYQKMLAEGLPGKLAAERAALVLSLVAGAQVMRQMIGLPALAHADPVALAGILAPVLQRLIAGEPS
jgi:hypothetical protein